MIHGHQSTDHTTAILCPRWVALAPITILTMVVLLAATTLVVFDDVPVPGFCGGYFVFVLITG